jgi:hypothetical protein
VKRAVVALAVTLCLAALGAHWIVRGDHADAQSPGAAAPVPPSTDEIGDRVQTVPHGQLPAFAREGDADTLYRFATTHGDVLRWMPCTCGCAQVGHTSNRSCYIKSETHADVTYTSHAAT